VDLGRGGVSCTPFIEDIAEAYAWADLVLCRSGASTCSEIAALGLPAIFVPYPFHADKQQFHNAQFLVEKGAAILVPQHELTVHRIEKLLRLFEVDHSKLGKMRAQKSNSKVLHADQLIAEYCLEIADA
jgi:UDP-N-acetylglucosamine--N-acetylmuramyl-(pentapeptide) pyrophosphoryl-undecaprenol N-acetylglucosamine transferase